MPIYGTGGSSTGKEFIAYWFKDASVDAHRFGNIRNLNVETGGNITREEDSGNRTPYIKQGSVAPSIRITYDVLNHFYITYCCIRNLNTVIPLHRILWYDGYAWFEAEGLVDSCRLRTGPADMLQCEVNVKVGEINPSAVDTYSGWVLDPLTHEDISTFNIAGAITNWERLEWGVDNQVDQISLGLDILPSEIFEKAARHTGSYRRTRRAAATFLDESQTGIGQNVTIAFTDKRLAPLIPVTTQFLYADAIIRNASVEDRDLDLIWESGDWEAESVTITP